MRLTLRELLVLVTFAGLGLAGISSGPYCLSQVVDLPRGHTGFHDNEVSLAIAKTSAAYSRLLGVVTHLLARDLSLKKQATDLNLPRSSARIFI
jgi:hypothetical protein